MTFLEAVKSCFSRYATFSGRSRRAEYWWFSLFVIVVSIALTGLDIAIQGLDYSVGIADLWSLATLLPGLAVGARRLHDIDRSGWWQLLLLIPLIGWIVLIVWLATPGQAGENRFGTDPLAAGRIAVFD